MHKSIFTTCIALAITLSSCANVDLLPDSIDSQVVLGMIEQAKGDYKGKMLNANKTSDEIKFTFNRNITFEEFPIEEVLKMNAGNKLDTKLIELLSKENEDQPVTASMRFTLDDAREDLVFTIDEFIPTVKVNYEGNSHTIKAVFRSYGVGRYEKEEGGKISLILELVRLEHNGKDIELKEPNPLYTINARRSN